VAAVATGTAPPRGGLKNLERGAIAAKRELKRGAFAAKRELKRGAFAAKREEEK
jgi:hypothetical protein